MLNVTKCILSFLLALTAVSAFSGERNANSDLSIEVDNPAKLSLHHEPLHPIPLHLSTHQNMANLGRQLFHDQRLAKNERISCADCHNLKRGGANSKPAHISMVNSGTKKNAPTIFNVIFNKSYYWEGRFISLDKQIDDSLKELGVTWEQLIEKITKITEYRARFESLFIDGVTRNNIKKALLAFEHTLVTPNARFDQYLRGNRQAINKLEKKGYELFKSYGCIACHQGINVGGNLIIYSDKAEIINNYVQTRNIPTQNNGISLTNRGELKIRVPSLRNVALTAPYYHDGSVGSLELAVSQMANQPFGIPIPYSDIQCIVLFLRTLTGEYNGKAL